MAQLQGYVAQAAGLELGELMVTVGRAKVDTPGSVTSTEVKKVIERAATFRIANGGSR